MGSSGQGFKKSKKIQVTGAKRGKTRSGKFRLGLVFLLIVPKKMARTFIK